MIREIVTEEDAWEACLALWKKLSEMPDRPCDGGSPSTLKNKVLNTLGYYSVANGCPFCGYFGTPHGCGDCPIAANAISCYETPYSMWEENWHSQTAAKAFYDFLSELYEKTHSSRS